MNKKRIAGVIALAAAGYLLWQWLTPVEIVAVHEGNKVLVKHFPYLKSRQIAWWEANKDLIQMKYGLPNKYSDGSYTVYIKDFGRGYRAVTYREIDDFVCFDDMQGPANCVEKGVLLRISMSRNMGLRYR